MKKLAIYMIGLASLIGLAGCLDDKNDYNYSSINKLDGEILNISSRYNLISGEELTITPTFKFTIDKENPDVSYEWRLDGKLISGENRPSCTFSFERSGLYEVTYSVIDNKTGVKFSASCEIAVRSPFTRGWLILSEEGNQESVLSFVGGRTVKYPFQYKNGDKIVDGVRDSLVYGDQIIRNILPGLGKHPKGLSLNAGFVGPYGEVFDISDEVIVMQERWAELSGKTLERSVYSDEEFRGDLPEAGFKPISIAMTFSAKAMLNEDGHIYWANNGFANDFHSCAYTSVPVNGGQKFTGVYPSYKLNRDNAAIPACTADNKIVGLMDAVFPIDMNKLDDPLQESSISGNVYPVKTSNGDEDIRFHLGNKKIVTMMPAIYGPDGSRDANPSWVTLLKEGAAYKLLYFTWKVSRSSSRPGFQVNEDTFFELDLPQLTGYTDMAVFNNKQYVVIANGSDLWYFQYGANALATLKKMHTFDHPIKALTANDLYAGKSQPEHNGQLGVALEDGTFWIYEVRQKKEAREGMDVELCMEASVNQLFPDPRAETPVDNKYGKVVDIIYKYGSMEDFISFEF